VTSSAGLRPSLVPWAALSPPSGVTSGVDPGGLLSRLSALRLMASLATVARCECHNPERLKQ